MLGTEDVHANVRQMAACEMIRHRSNDDTTSSSFVLQDPRILTGNIDRLIDDVITDGRDMELGHLLAVSADFGVTIQSYIPPTAAVGFGSRPYTTLLVGRDVRSTLAPTLTLMWSMMSEPAMGASYNASHIILLHNRPNEDDMCSTTQMQRTIIKRMRTIMDVTTRYVY